MRGERSRNVSEFRIKAYAQSSFTTKQIEASTRTRDGITKINVILLMMRA